MDVTSEDSLRGSAGYCIGKFKIKISNFGDIYEYNKFNDMVNIRRELY
jgi:hypothetical protein